MRHHLKRLLLVVAAFCLISPALAWALDYVPGEIIIVYEDVPVDVDADVSAQVYELLEENVDASDSDEGQIEDVDTLEIDALGMAELGEKELELEADAEQPVLDEISSTQDVIDALGFETTEDLPATDDSSTVSVLAEVPDDLTVDEAVALLEDVPGVAYAQPNYVYELVEPVEAQAAQWEIDDARGIQTFLTHAKVREARMYARTDAKITVAVIDSGCRLDHEDLLSVLDLEHAIDFSNKDEDTKEILELPLEGDEYGHGTHVSGVLAAEANNTIGIAGSSYNARIIPVRVLNANGATSSAQLARGIGYVATLKSEDVSDSLHLRIANLSLGLYRDDTTVHTMIEQLSDLGVLCVCAGGNKQSTNYVYPSDYDECLSVMGLEEDGCFAAYNDYNDAKDIAATGRALSTYKTSDKSYVTMSGSSSATPVVSGVAALVWSTNPDLTADEVRDILLTTADAVPSGGESSYNAEASQNVRSVNAYAAVLKAISDYDGESLNVPVVIDVPAQDQAFVYNSANQGPVIPEGAVVQDGITSAKEPGTYTMTLALPAIRDRVVTWENGSTDPIEVTWSIQKATLTATYAGGTIWTGDAAPTTVTVTGFVGSETAATAAGYKAPRVSVSSQQRNTPGTFSISPAGGEATNYTFRYVAGRLTVRQFVKATSISLNKTTATLKPTATLALGVTFNPTNVSDKSITWKSSNTNVATVSSTGKVTAKAVGTARITATTSSRAGSRSATCTIKVQIPAARVVYRTHVQKIGWQNYVANGKTAGTSGKSLRLEAIDIILGDQPYDGSIAYRTHIQKLGWETAWKKDGDMSGTSNRALRLEAIQIKLTGKMATYYDVYYRVHAQHFGWMGWAKNGARAGTAGYAYRLEAIQIQLVPKGGAAPGSTSRPFRQK